jgi:glycosyltransferase involved in cell wall biosynthesis
MTRVNVRHEALAAPPPHAPLPEPVPRRGAPSATLEPGGYGLRDHELDALPTRVALAPGEAGLGVVLRDRGRLVGFRLLARAELDADGGLAGADLVDQETREAAAVERLRTALATATPPPPSLTVAICSKDRWDWVDRLLGSLEAVRDGDPFEVLVVDNASSHDRIAEVCAARGVRCVREPLAGLDFARNRALAEAKGEVVAFLDDDVTVEPTWLWGLRRAWAENPDAGCVTGLVLPMALDTEAQVLFELRGGFRRGFRPARYGAERYRERHYPAGSGRFGAGANMSLRRDLVRALGGFDEALDTGRPLPGGGDLDIFYRVLRSGATLVYEPQAAVRHEHRRETAALARQYYTWGLGFAAYVVKSMRADPAARPQFRRLMVWWFGHQAKRLLRRLQGGEPTPTPMIAGEIWGGIVGLCGEYGRSRRRVAAIRAAAP